MPWDVRVGEQPTALEGDAEIRSQELLYQLQLLSGARRMSASVLKGMQPLARETSAVHTTDLLITKTVRDVRHLCHLGSPRALGHERARRLEEAAAAETHAKVPDTSALPLAPRPSTEPASALVPAQTSSLMREQAPTPAPAPHSNGSRFSRGALHRPAPKHVVALVAPPQALTPPLLAPSAIENDPGSTRKTLLSTPVEGADVSADTGAGSGSARAAMPPSLSALSNLDEHALQRLHNILGAESGKMENEASLPVRRHPHSKRSSSSSTARGARNYSAWVRKADSIRNVLTKGLRSDVADCLVLTGSKISEGKVTSLSMVAQSMAQHKRTVAALKMDPCFKKTSNMHLSMIASVAKTRHHSRYSIVYREGAAAMSFFLLIKGGVLCSTAEGPVEVLQVESTAHPVCFGTEGVVDGVRRATTAMCTEDCEILHFTASRSHRIGGSTMEDLAKTVFAAFVEAELKKMPLFFDLRSDVVSEIASMFELREFGEAGITIFDQGMQADELFCLAKGRVLLEDIQGTELAKLTAGSIEDGYPFFGQDSLLKRGMREDSATTRTPCKLLVIRRPHFSRLLKLMPLLMERLQDFDRRYRERAKLAREIKEAEKERKDVEARRKQLTIKSENAKLESAATNLQRGTRGMLARRQTRDC